jgi:predicted nucleotidyltransferase
VVTEQTLHEAVARLVSAAHAPLKVILFGSRAEGRERPDSDVDLLVVEEDIPDVVAEYSRLRHAVGSIGAGVDILLYPRVEFERRLHWSTSPVRDAATRGRVLFQADAAG